MTDSAYDWYEKATIAFEKLSPKKGDLVTITVPRNTDPRQMEMVAMLVDEACQELKEQGVTFMVVQGGIDFANFPEEVMARYGWIKVADQ